MVYQFGQHGITLALDSAYGLTLATYDAYPYSRMGSMGGMYPSHSGGPSPGPAKTSAMPYAVNGVSLSTPGVDLLHPAMTYQGKSNKVYRPIFI